MEAEAVAAAADGYVVRRRAVNGTADAGDAGAGDVPRLSPNGLAKFVGDAVGRHVPAVDLPLKLDHGELLTSWRRAPVPERAGRLGAPGRRPRAGWGRRWPCRLFPSRPPVQER